MKRALNKLMRASAQSRRRNHATKEDRELNGLDKDMNKLTLLLMLMGSLLSGCVAYEVPGRGYGGGHEAREYHREGEAERREYRREGEREFERNDHERHHEGEGEGSRHDNRQRD